MDRQTLELMFAGITPETKRILAHDRPKQLATILRAVYTGAQITPAPADVFAAFRLCPIESTRIVLLGQDPYIGVGEAHGLSFSTTCITGSTGSKLPPSLRNIYNCLHGQGLIRNIPTSGDLSPWASRGVLLLNCALTTIVGKSNEHKDIWSQYTDDIITAVSDYHKGSRKLVFILLGAFAKKKTPLIDLSHEVIEWSHPSPLNSKNNRENPDHFKYCPAFREASRITGIDWNLEPNLELKLEPLDNTADTEFTNALTEFTNNLNGLIATITPDVITPVNPLVTPPPDDESAHWFSTDGGALANGKKNCVASYGWYYTDGKMAAYQTGQVLPVDIPGKVYRSSNNRGELTALMKALSYLVELAPAIPPGPIVFVYDSEYAYKSVFIWCVNKTPEQITLNADIIIPCVNMVRKLKSQGFTITLKYRKSHDKPTGNAHDDPGWYFNQIADKLCEKTLADIAA